MTISQIGKIVALFAMLFVLSSPQGLFAEGLRGGFDEAFGPRIHPQTRSAPPEVKHRPRHGMDRATAVRHWNQIAIDASGLDHTPVASGETRVFGEQLGPDRSSRAMAIVHLAVFEVVNAIEGNYTSYIGLAPAKVGASLNAGVSQAAYDTLVALFPSQTAAFDTVLAESLSEIPDGRMKANGIALGKRAAAAILAARANDGSQHSEPRVGIEFLTSNDPGKWRQDPISQITLALGAYWGEVKPFVLERGDQFRAPVPPRIDSAAYAAAYNEVKMLGGDGVVTPTIRSAEQTQIGIFWAYDGTPSLCAPPRLYNQIAMRIANKMGTDTDVLELARLLALVNVAMADAGIAVWESKYYYQYWRPVTGIRESDEHTGPSGLGDGNPATAGDPTFSPLGAPASNLTGPNFTPPFPAYPSGHAGFGGALFEMLRNYYKTDRIRFTFISDEFNGVTRDHAGNLRPLVERSFSSLSQAEEENGQSRIYLGIHWSFDKTEGIAQGRRVAEYVFKNMLRRRQGR
ncbi:MAG: phosphatase PAP2 family protein [Nitrospirae bacterium]|nr:phosphatase PAP2 family protein [Nitrospirota bacterium]